MANIVRAVDLGFGNTKFTVAHFPGFDIDCRLFPSLAPLATAIDLSGGAITRRDTVIIEADGNDYEIGPDVGLVMGTRVSRRMQQTFLKSTEYLALYRGALSYMNAGKIDLLVAGLPVSLLSSKSDDVRQRLQGIHPIAHGKIISVEKVLVLAQPLGGYIDFSLTHTSYDRLRESKNLIVDPGYFTLDWIVSKGLQPIPQRCGSFSGGMYAALRLIARAISSDYQIDFDDYESIDEALRTGTLHLFGKTIAVEEYSPSAQPAIDEAVNALVNSVGDGRDIEKIVVVGGAGQFFRTTLERRFPSHPVILLPNPVFSNVRGFQFAGEELLHTKNLEVA